MIFCSEDEQYIPNSFRIESSAGKRVKVGKPNRKVLQKMSEGRKNDPRAYIV